MNQPPFKRIALAVLAVLAMARFASAQTNTNTNPPPVVITSHTNLYLKTAVSLTAYVQEVMLPNPLDTNLVLFSVSVQHLNTKAITEALINDLNGGTNDLKGATLMLRVTDVGTTNENNGFILRKGTNVATLEKPIFFNVPPYFQLANNNSEFISQDRRAGNGKTNSTDYVDLSLSFGTSKGAGELSGFVKLKQTSVVMGHTLISAKPNLASINASLAGSGSFGGKPAVFKGTLVCTGRKVEVVQGP